MSRNLIFRGGGVVYDTGITPEMRDVCLRRIQPLLKEYGRSITYMSIETLCASCYAQGVSDMATLSFQRAPEGSK